MRLIGVLVVCILLIQCGKKNEDDGLLELSVRPKKAYLINADRQTCADVRNNDNEIASASKMSLGMSQLTLKWNSDEDLYLVNLRVVVKNLKLNNGNYSLDFVSDEIYALFLQYGSTIISRNLLIAGRENSDTPRELVSDPQCLFAFGGFEPTDPERPFTVSGKIKAYGFYRKDDVDIPVTAETQFQIYYPGED